MHTICNIARNTFNVCALSATLRAINVCPLPATTLCLQFRAQKGQRVPLSATFRATLHEFNACLLSNCNIAHNKFNVYPLSTNLRAINMCPLPATTLDLQYCGQWRGTTISHFLPSDRIQSRFFLLGYLIRRPSPFWLRNCQTSELICHVSCFSVWQRHDQLN